MDNEWVRTQLRLNPGKSKADLARVLNIEPPAVSKILAGTRQIKAHEYVAMRRFFGLPVDGERAVGAYKHADESASYMLTPLNESADGAIDADSWMIPAKLLAGRTKALPGQVKVFPIQDGAMAPDFLPGEFILVDLSDLTPSPPGVFVVSDGVGDIVRQCEIVHQSNPVTIRISAVNKRYETHESVLDRAGIVGRVIAKLQWI